MTLQPHRPITLVVTALLLTGAAPARAQTFPEIDAMLGRADTAAAMAALEALLGDDGRKAEAHYRLGVLHRARIDHDAAVDANRRAAEEHFRYATRFESDSAKYFVALADLFRRQNNSFTRLQIPGLLERARAAASRVGAAAGDQSQMEYRAARSEWERYEHYGRRFLPNDFAGPLRAGVSEYLFYAEWAYVENFFRTRSRMAGEAGESYRVKAEDHLRAALALRPGNVDAAGLLLILMSEQGRWPEGLTVTRALVRAAPTSGQAWALHGMALARELRWPESEAAFDTALARMTPREREPYLDLGQLMRRADRRGYARLPEDARALLDTTYWAAAQPLALTDANELRAEFLARITYVEHRWSDPIVGYRGHETDIGGIYVRYGPPDIWAVFNREQIVWVYLRPRLRFLFDLTPGFSRARFAGFSREAAREAAEQSPARFDNVPIFRALDTILVQTAQFRSANQQSTTVGVYAAVPLRRMIDSTRVTDLVLNSAVILTSEHGRELGRTPRGDIIRDVPEHDVRNETWYLDLIPRSYFLRVEAHLPAVDRAARAASMLDVRGYAARDRLLLSDVLAADHLAPRDSVYHRWTDFFIEPNGGRFEPDEPLAILWEMYNLRTDSTGMARYRVDLRITVEAIERRGWAARVLGGIGDAMGLTAQGDDEVSLQYEQSVQPDSSGTQVEYLTIDLRDAPQGRYTVSVEITDLLGGHTATRERTIWVSARSPERLAPWEQ